MKSWLKWIGIGIVGYLVVVAILSGRDSSDLKGRLKEANARAEEFELRFLEKERAWRALGIQVETDSLLREDLREENEALAKEISRARGTILSLQRINASLRAELRSDSLPALVSDSTVTFDILTRKEWNDGKSWLEVSGPATVHLLPPPPIASVDLTARGRFGLSVVLDRRNETDLAVSAFFDNPAFTVEEIRLIQNVRDPLTMEKKGFWHALEKELFSLEAWRHRAEGAGIALLLTQ